MKNIGFIGVGELALYTIRGVRRGGYEGVIRLSPRNHDKAALLAAQHNCEVQVDNQSVVDNSDCVVIATRPADCLQTLTELEFRPGQLLISVVAGVEISELRKVIPARLDVVRAMPVSSAEAGASPTLIYPDNEFVREFFNHCGNTIPVDNEDYFTQGSVLACVYCWFFSLFESLIQATQGPALTGATQRRTGDGYGARCSRTRIVESRQFAGGDRDIDCHRWHLFKARAGPAAATIGIRALATGLRAITTKARSRRLTDRIHPQIIPAPTNIDKY